MSQNDHGLHMPTSRRNKNEEESSVLLKLHIRPATQNLIDRAVKLLGKTRSEFILEASKQSAEEVLLDQTVFTVSPEVYADLLARLDTPAQPNEGLIRLMALKAPWDEG